MENTEKKSILTRFQDFLDTAKGRIILNYLYSWGAAIVILGALFKLTHIAGANLMLFIGMGTEVLVFFISGFERPFIPSDAEETEESDAPAGGTVIIGGNVPQGNIYINGGASTSPNCGTQATSESAVSPEEISGASAPVVTGAGNLDVSGVESATQQYIDQLNELTEKLQKLSQQSDTIISNSQEFDALGRNLISINQFYEMQLRSASTQMDNIDQVNGETRHMLEQIAELNKVYERMVEAMKVNGVATQK